jgi:hypothetical protein
MLNASDTSNCDASTINTTKSDASTIHTSESDSYTTLSEFIRRSSKSHGTKETVLPKGSTNAAVKSLDVRTELATQKKQQKSESKQRKNSKNGLNRLTKCYHHEGQTKI